MFAKIATSTLIFLFASILSTSANAVFIDFDDIVAPPFNPFNCETPDTPCGLILSDEYASEGLVFPPGNSWLAGETLSDGSVNNRVAGLNTIYIQFNDITPNFISLNIDSALRFEASYIDVFGKDGLLFTYITSGLRGTDQEATPYIPNEFISFHSDEPILEMAISSLYNHRTGPRIDNLTFEYRTVPEPSLLLLLISAVGIIFYRKRRAAFIS